MPAHQTTILANTDLSGAGRTVIVVSHISALYAQLVDVDDYGIIAQMDWSGALLLEHGYASQAAAEARQAVLEASLF